MATPFVGEIRMFSFPRIPLGWQACDGSLLSISGFETLFNLIGTTYGGNGQTNFGVPDLRGRVPLHQGIGHGLTPRVIGQPIGVETVALTSQTTAGHTHAMLASQAQATAAAPATNLFLGKVDPDTLYFTTQGSAKSDQMYASTVGQTGGSAPHDNTMPTLTVSYCIAVDGIYPTQ